MQAESPVVLKLSLLCRVSAQWIFFVAWSALRAAFWSTWNGRGVLTICPDGVAPSQLVHERLWKVGPLNVLVSEDPAPGPETPDTVIIITIFIGV